MEEKLKNLEPELLALAEALRDMPWVDQVEITRIRESDRYEMRAYMLEDPNGLLRDVRPERIDCLGVFWRGGMTGTSCPPQGKNMTFPSPASWR